MTQPAVVAAPVTTTVTTTAKRPGAWGTDFVDRFLGPAKPATPVVAGKVTHLQAAGHALLDGVVSIGTGGLLGAAHAKGWLDFGHVAVDGVLGGFGLAIGAIAEPYFPTFARAAMGVGAAGFTTLGFRKGFESVAGRPMSASKGGVVDVTPGEDRIAKVAKELDL